MRAIIETTKSVIKKTRTYLYHNEHNRDAHRILKIVEKQKGPFNQNHKRLCIEYAQDVFGDKKYAPWLFVYSAFAREFKEGWISNNYYGQIVIPSINGNYGVIGDRNAVLNGLLRDMDTLDLGYYVNQLFIDTNYNVLSEQELKKHLFKDNEKVVYKIEDSQRGQGIYFFKEKDFNTDTIKKLGNGVFQKYIIQHPFYNQFTDTSVATIRITSVCDDEGNIEPRVGYFRFGRKNDSHVISKSALKLPFNIKTGELFDTAYYPTWKPTKHLPDNDVAFAGKILPEFDKCIDKIKNMHSKVPFIRCIGWDVIVNNNNDVELIELNGGHSGIKFSETVQGPNFKGLNWEKLHKTN